MTRKEIIIKLSLFLLLQAAVLGGIVSLSFSRFSAYQQAEQSAYRAKIIDNDINKMEKSILGMQSAVRGYNLTGNPKFLETYKQHKEEFNLNDLENEVTDIPPQLDRVRRLKVLINQKIANMDQGQTRRTFEQVTPMVNIGEELTVKIRELAQEMRDRESELLEERQIIARDKAEEFQRYLFAIVISEIAFLVIGCLLLGKSYFYRFKLEEDLKESVDELKTVYDSISDTVITLNESSRIMYCNFSVATTFGYEIEELIGRSITDLMTPSLAQQHMQGMARYIASGKKTLNWKLVETTGVKKNGQEFPIAISFGEYWQNDQRRFIGVIRDITDRVEREKSLVKLNKELGEFTSIASHDLQSPIRYIKNYLEIIELKYGNLFPEEALGYFIRIKESATKMSELIKDLLAYSRSGKFSEKEEVNIQQLTEEVVENLNVKDCVIEITNLPIIRTHRVGFTQIMQNLIGNSLKFSPNKCDIRVKCKDKGEFWEFSVSDTGIGIEEKYFEKVWEPFQRLNSSLEGSGIGLSIVKKTVDALQGRVWLTSKLGEGTTFYFTVRK